MRLVFVGDVHLSVVPPARRAEGYLEELFDMLEEIRQVCVTENAHAWFVGDLLHHKGWHRNPHWLINRLMGVLSAFPNNVYITVGNHDLADGTMESFERQPLAMLNWVENVIVLNMESCRWFVPEPGSKDPDDGITVQSISGTAKVTEARDEAKEFFDTGAQLIVAHAPISPRKLPWKTWHPSELPIKDETRWLVYGHQHDQAGAWDRVDSLDAPYQVISSGCLARGSIREADTRPTVMMLDTTNGFVDGYVLQSARPAADIYRWVEREEEVQENRAMTAFVEALGSATLSGFSREGLIATIGERSDLDVPVKQMAIEILESVR